jgi:PKD repeat protein
MKRFGLLMLALIGLVSSLSAAHIRGGELTYRHLGSETVGGVTRSRYELTLKLYVDCSARGSGQLDESVTFTIFEKTGGVRILQNVTAPFTTETRIQYDPNSNPCILNPPTDVCYRLRYYSTIVTLPDTEDGYSIAFQRCCRIDNIRNVAGNSGDVGVTYSCEIPGTRAKSDAPRNSSPSFNPNDAIAICAGSGFTFDFSAEDPDADSLVYDFCNAYVGGGRDPGNCTSCTSPVPTSSPPFSQVNYRAGLTGNIPLGGSVSINSQTGLISGIAPNAVGQYVVTVCVREYRDNILINTHRKDIHIAVSNCQPLRALLSPDYQFCDDFLVTFQNGQANPAGAQYIWNFGDGTGNDTVTTALGQIQHQYADTGTYTVKLKVLLANGQCQDSTTTLAKVYPGFFPGFVAQGSCILTPFTFVDTTYSRYGTVAKWNWNFGDETTDTDVANTRNPSYRYNSLGFKTVTLEVESDKGCKGTATAQVEVRDRPNLFLPFKDTLICSIDELPLSATAPGTLAPVFTWTPVTNIRFDNTANPVVDPKTTTTYKVRVDDNGCTAEDSILVRVVDFVTLSTSPDTTICLTDSVRIEAFGDGLRYEWSPAADLDDPASRTPTAMPAGTTTYQVISHIGGCSTSDQVTVTTVPYPFADAGPDQAICFSDSIMLVANITGASFDWNPKTTLLDHHTLNPIAYPRFSTTYVLTVYDTIGCPKPGYDTVFVSVRPPVPAFAGNDTAIVVGQPLQLNGRGGEFYLWEPAFGLNATDIQNPIATLTQSQTYTVRVSTPEGCFAYDTINIAVYRTAPDIFVPNAFTPGKSTNNVFRPIMVGISQLDYFRVYNRWGQLVFSSAIPGHGWDGKIGGRDQGTDTYVWMVQGKDYTGKTIFKKGTVVLLR